MNTKKSLKLTAIIAGGFIIAIGILLGVTGYWPIAFVDGTPITYGTFKENFMMADHYYRSNLKLAGEDDRVVMAKDVQRDLQRVTMEGLVEGILIDHELAKRYASGDLGQLIDNKVGGIDLSSTDIGKATELLYGLTPGGFKGLVLLPKAKQEILEGNLTLQNGTFDGWLAAKRSEAHVSIFVPALFWDKGEVKLK
jgi:hypothetical protein